MKHIALILTCLLLGACSKTMWVKPGSSREAFSQAKYECLRENKERVSGVAWNAYGGQAANTTRVDKGMYLACMNAKGFYLQRVSVR